MVEGGVEVVDDADGEDQVEVLGIPVGIGRGIDLEVDCGARALVTA